MRHDVDIRRADPHSHEIPALRGIPLLDTDSNQPVRLLSTRQRHDLAAIAVRERVPRRTILYREHAPATSVFIVGQGIVKVFRDLPNGKRPVLAFLFPEDIFGLIEAGHYVSTAQTVTDAVVFRMPLVVLRDTLAFDAELGLQFLCKVTHQLRESQRHRIAIERRDAVGKMATFLRRLDQRHTHGERHGVIHMPMTRSDVAGYLGLSLEAVSRACRRLERSGVVTFIDRHRARVLDQRALDKLASAY
jgi:CRP-like cAMP-binding protein